jgi:hypothetical protein
MGGWCKERYNKDENNNLEGLHQKPDQMEETSWEGQNFSEVVAPQEEEEEEWRSCSPCLTLNHMIYLELYGWPWKIIWLAICDNDLENHMFEVDDVIWYDVLNVK